MRRGPLPPPGVLDPDRRRRRAASSSTSSLVGAARSPTEWLDDRGPKAWRDGIALRHPRPLGSLSRGLRRDAARRHPGGRSLPCREARQRQARRVPPAGAERDPRPPRPQGRPALSVPAPAHQGRRTPRGQRTREARSACFAPAIPKGEVTTAWHAKEAVRELYAHTDADARPASGSSASSPTWPTRDNPIEVRSLGRTLRRWKRPDRRLAPRPRQQRTDRGGQQPDQAREARRLRLHELPQLPDPRHCSTPASPTGTCSRRSHPAEIRSAG